MSSTATNLERNLYLTVQLLELGIPMVMALNIYDEAEAKGYRIDITGIEKMLGVTVIPTSATKKSGLDELLKSALQRRMHLGQPAPRELSYGEDIEYRRRAAWQAGCTRSTRPWPNAIRSAGCASS